MRKYFLKTLLLIIHYSLIIGVKMWGKCDRINVKIIQPSSVHFLQALLLITHYSLIIGDKI